MSEHSYTITLSNNKTEKRAFKYVLSQDSSFLIPTTEGRKYILNLFGITKKFSRAFDLVKVPSHIVDISQITSDDKPNICLVELKTTAKYLPNFPKGFFFGATENEFQLAKQLGDQYKFCFVCLHEKTMGHQLLSVEELEKLIITKRIQYQVNL